MKSFSLFPALYLAFLITPSLGFMPLPTTTALRRNLGRCNGFTNPNIVEGPPIETKPDYEKIHGPLGPTLDKVFLTVFRTKMAEQIGPQYDSKLPKDDYQGLMELAGTMNVKYNQREAQKLSQNILRTLFPSWLPNAFGWMFAKPFPAFSAKMNAWATVVAGTWLMGECEINDCKIDGDVGDEKSGVNQGLLVKRCRFLEESGCASVCVNSCKLPTQQFFIEDMGLPLTMEPDYETYECQFSFGLSPTLQDELDAKGTPCLSRCPSSGGLRSKHMKKDEDSFPLENSSIGTSTCSLSCEASKCFMMDDQSAKRDVKQMIKK